VRAAVVIKGDIELAEIREVGFPHIGDEGRFRPAFLLRTDHDRRAVRVIRTDEHAAVAAELLKAHPDIGLDVLDQMPEVNVPIGVRQRGGNENATDRH
jgi:hypothetical protein